MARSGKKSKDLVRMQQPSIVCFGEMLWDLLPSGKVAGGAPMNVAIHLKRLGAPTHFISRVGADPLGDELLDWLKKTGLSAEGIQKDPQLPTGQVIVELDALGNATYDIVQPSAWDHIAVSPEARNWVRSADYFVFGSLVAREPYSANTLRRLLEYANTRVFDVNLRKPFYKREQIISLMLSADIVKMNAEELEIANQWLGPWDDQEEAIAGLADTFEWEACCVTLGDQGAILFEEGEFYRHSGFKVNVKDTVGSGDAFLATWLQQRLSGAKPAAALRAACAMGALTATHTGATPLLSKDDLAHFLEQHK